MNYKFYVWDDNRNTTPIAEHNLENKLSKDDMIHIEGVLYRIGAIVHSMNEANVGLSPMIDADLPITNLVKNI